MAAHKILAVFIILSMMLFLVACEKSTVKSESDKAKASISVASNSSTDTLNNDKTCGSDSTQVASLLEDDKSDIFFKDIREQADLYATKSSIIALAMLICKLDDSQDYFDLIKCDAKELFAQLREAAIQDNITLETLDENYSLSRILGCEGIYVEFSSNNVTYIMNPSQETKDDYVEDWVEQFEGAIREDEIKKN